MPLPRFKQYTNLNDKPKPKKKPVLVAIKRFLLFIIAILVILACASIIARKVPIRNSLMGDYKPPVERTEIPPFSLARWNLQGVHADELSVNLAWYHRVKLSPALSMSELEMSGFRPFLFIDENGELVPVLDAGIDPKVNPAHFLLALVTQQGTSAGFISRKSIEQISLVGRRWPEATDEAIMVNPQERTSIHGQFLPESPQFAEEYACFCAQLWESAASDYATIYEKPPDSLDSMLDGIGLIPNPKNVWPLDEGRLHGVDLECGVIDGKIIYWQVTFAGGATRGQARYWDQYTSFDDPETPENIITPSITSAVVDPGLISGSRNIMLNLDILKGLLDQAEPDE
jgi:hypothetical protein